MPNRIAAISIMGALAMIGAALAAVPLTAQGAMTQTAGSGPCVLADVGLDPGYGVSRIVPVATACDGVAQMAARDASPD